MIAEVRTKGYARSLALLQSRMRDPALAKKIIGTLEDRRALWAPFDAEFPDRVRQSLDQLRLRFIELRDDLPQDSPMDHILLSLTKTIHTFFNTVESSDLTRLRCDSTDPEWLRFRDALSNLRKAIGLQISNLASVYGVTLSQDLQRTMPRT